MPPPAKPGVPTAVFGPLLLRAASEGFDMAFEGEARLDALAEKVGLSEDTVRRIIEQRRELCDFNTADKLLCALNVTHWWWEEPLKPIYDSIELWEKCRHPDCKVWWKPKTPGSRKRYCSTSCANSHAAGNRRIKHTMIRPIKGYHSRKCRNGHTRTPENTIKLQSGKIRCRICNNASARRSHARLKEGAV